MYESDITKFLRELLEKNPELVDQQKRLRATWWEKQTDPEVERKLKEMQVPQKAYVYFSNK